MSRAQPGVTKPAAGVITTSPATTPEAAPRALGLPSRIHSTSIQERAPGGRGGLGGGEGQGGAAARRRGRCRR